MTKRRIIWIVTICAAIVLGALNGACNNYSRYNVADATYDGRCPPSTYAGNATTWLTFLGFEVDKATRDTVTTKWETWFTGRGRWVREHQARVVVDIKAKTIEGQCLTRLVRGAWKFTPCKNQNILKWLTTAVHEVAVRITG